MSFIKNLPLTGLDDAPLTSLSLTHVSYIAGDPVSYVCAWLSLVPQALCVIYVTLMWSTREAEVILMFAGQMGCEAFNFLLKRLIREERPKKMLGKGYGMPSSHAQFASFFAVYLVLFLLLRHRPSDTSTKHTKILPSAFIYNTLSAIAFVCVAAGVALARIYLHYHTPKQVLVGCAAGTTSAVAWFIFTSYLRSSKLLEWALRQPLAREFRLRDLVIKEDLAESGWRRWEARETSKKTR